MDKRMDFVVEGSGRFPFDMLRYDSCFPARETDSNAMAGDYDAERRQVRLRTTSHNEFDVNYPTDKRWESFTWRVVSRNP